MTRLYKTKLNILNTVDILPGSYDKVVLTPKKISASNENKGCLEIKLDTVPETSAVPVKTF